MAKQKFYIRGFWERMEEAVTSCGLSKCEIARRCGFDRKVLMDYRNHDRMISSGYLARFCAVTGVSADWILGLSNMKLGGALTVELFLIAIFVTTVVLIMIEE